MAEFDYLKYLQQHPETFGKTFKEMRLAKGISAKGVFEKHRACSRRTLYNFENGKTCVNILILSALLANINVSVTDYFAVVFHHQANADEKFIKEIVNYCYKNDIAALEKILEEKCAIDYGNLENHAYILMISTFLYEMQPGFKISKEVLENAGDYFFKLDRWGYPELTLFCNTVHVLNINLVILITKDLIKKKEEFCSNMKKRELFLRILLNTSYTCIKHSYLKDANYFFDLIDDLIGEQVPESTLLERIVLKFMKGFYSLIDGNTSKGKRLMKKAIELFAITEIPNLEKRYKQYYKEALLQVKEKIKFANNLC